MAVFQCKMCLGKLDILKELTQNFNAAEKSEIQAISEASYRELGEPLVNDCFRIASESYNVQ